jgi:7-carboxy-7-deazaguanine synthase
MSNLLRITEIFLSLQGETNTAGIPTVFVRLTGCPLRCAYCDTAYAFSGGELQKMEDIVQQVMSYGIRYVTVTGGEPLAQEGCLDLLTCLCNEKLNVSLETSGAIDISKVDPRVVKVMDIKTPDSGEMHRNLNTNLEHLGSRDQIKFVICSQDDYEWAKQRVVEHKLMDKVCEVLMSANHGVLESCDLAEWILRDRLHVRLQIQLHKYLWGDKPGV